MWQANNRQWDTAPTQLKLFSKVFHNLQKKFWKRKIVQDLLSNSEGILPQWGFRKSGSQYIHKCNMTLPLCYVEISLQEVGSLWLFQRTWQEECLYSAAYLHCIDQYHTSLIKAVFIFLHSRNLNSPTHKFWMPSYFTNIIWLYQDFLFNLFTAHIYIFNRAVYRTSAKEAI